MYDFFKNITEINACSFAGACSIHPSISALYQIILNEIREISFYSVKLKEFKIVDKEAINLAILGLSIFFINTSFNQNKYLEFVDKLCKAKIRVRELYMKYCAQNEFPCEIIKTNFVYEEGISISELINYAQNNLSNKQKNIDKTKMRLFELITLFARLYAIEVVKIKKIEPNFNEFDFEILRFFALTNGYSIRNEKIKRRIKQFSDFSLKIANKLSNLYKEKYGEKQSANTRTTSLCGHCILVSGDDLDELSGLLEKLKEMDLDDEINVYTHGPLFLAHFYPYFQNNSSLKGHLGTDNPEYDFSVFDGSVLITQNFIQKIDNLYRGEIYSNKIISFSKVFDVKDNDYEPLINSALKLDMCKQMENKSICVEYNKEKINNLIKEDGVDEIVIISGEIPEDDYIEKHKNKKFVQINCSYENDILYECIEKTKQKNIKLTLFFSECNMYSLSTLLSLLGKEVKLNIANCPHSLINPHVIECLREDFGVNII